MNRREDLKFINFLTQKKEPFIQLDFEWMALFGYEQWRLLVA